MLQLFRKEDPEIQQLLGRLLGTNTPPSDEERDLLNASLQRLKSKYTETCQAPYSASSAIPRSGRKIHQDIQRHQRVLSCVRRLPAEILRMLFDLYIHNRGPKQALFQAVTTTRLVSKRWNSVAVGYPRLWQNIPLINISTMPRFQDKHAARIAAHRALGPYLARSRPLPISFSLHFWRNQNSRMQPGEIHAQEWLLVLLLELHRWDEVEFRASKKFLDILGRRMERRNSVPLLSKFVFEMQSITQSASTAKDVLYHLNLSGAPRLRHVEFDTLSSFRTTDTSVLLVLPWEQLEVFKGVMPRDSSYPILVEKGTKVQVLKSAAGEVDGLPSSQGPAALQRLTQLSLCFGSDLAQESLIAHLGCLTLPSLKELEVYWWKNVELDLYSSISSLVRRSGCSLERLATENSLDHEAHPELQNKFLQLMRQCSDLTHIDIGYLTTEELDALVPDKSNNNKKPALSNLRVLTLRFPHDALEGKMDPVSLLAVVQARTGQDRKQPHSKLEDVYIKHRDNDAWRVALLSLGGERSTKVVDVPFDPGFLEICRLWKDELLEYIDSQPMAPRVPSTSKSKPNPQLARTIKGMASFNLRGRDVRILPLLGVPRLLDSLGRENQQARELLEKWKPTLIKSFQSSPYRWCYVDSVTSRLRFVENEPHASNVTDEETADEQDWERILGGGDIDSWAAGPKGSMWQMGPLMLAKHAVIVDSESD